MCLRVQTCVQYSSDSPCSRVVSGKSDELPRKPLGQELPLLLSPVQPTRGRPSSASGFPGAGLSLHIISHRPDSISLDQSPSKDPRDLDALEEEEAPLPSPDPVIIHSQAPLTPDGSPLMGPPPYQPPGSQTAVTAGRPSVPDQGRDEGRPEAAVAAGPDSAQPTAGALSTTSADGPSSVAASTDRSSREVPWTLSVQVASPGWGLGRSEGPAAAESAEDSYLVRLLEQASALCADGSLNRDSRTASGDTGAPDVS